MKALKAIGGFIAKLPNTKIGGVIGKAVDTKAGKLVDQVATGGIFTSLFKPTPENPVGKASPAQWTRAIIQVSIIAYLIYTGKIDQAIAFYESSN